MRNENEVILVQALIRLGLNDCEISRRTGIPRRTVLDWRAGRVPQTDRHASGRVLPEAEAAYAQLLGLYLGDGHIARARRTYRLRITLDGLYPGIVRECRAAIETVVPNRVNVARTQSRAVVVNAYSNAWPSLFPQHGDGVKHERAVTLAPWQAEITRRWPERLIRGLLQSDGCRTTNTVRNGDARYVYVRYEFSNRSDDIRAIFCDHLDLLEIPWRPMDRWTVSVARREAVARLDEFVGPKR